MKEISSSLCVGSLLALAVFIVPVHAQQARSFVSNAVGNDGNAPNCTRNAPCRTFQTAHDNTLDLGEITVLDPGSYGAVTITKNISIINDGVGEAGILVSGGATAITVNAPLFAAVSLRGLTIKGIGFGGGTGIIFNTGALLSIEHCVIRNLTAAQLGVPGTGIFYSPAVSGGNVGLSVSDTVVTDNTSSGIYLLPRGNGLTNAVFTRVQSIHNGFDGFAVDFSQTTSGNATNRINVTIESSAAVLNARAGYEILTSAGAAPVFMNVIRSVAHGNQNGFLAPCCNTLAIGQSAIMGNGTTWAGNGIIETYGDNYVEGNIDNNPAFPFTHSRQ